MKKLFLPLLAIAILLFILFIFRDRFFTPSITPEDIAKGYVETPTLTATPTPTPKPLTFEEMNKLYGPCTRVSVLMYHHVQDLEKAKSLNQQSLTVSTETFKEQMQYLKDRGYKTIYASDLNNFFDQGIPVPGKSILITFDDGYEDFASDALPILRGVGFNSIVFVPTGLMNNGGYLNWDSISGIAGVGDVMFANHTWSHKNMGSDTSTIKSEITTADIQLTERNLNSPKVFAYPYGLSSGGAIKTLSDLGYTLAFTTKPGSIQCKANRFELTRIRIGNVVISNYGF